MVSCSTTSKSTAATEVRRRRSAVCLGTVAVALACSACIAAGIGIGGFVAAGTIAAVASQCHDHAQIDVIDGRTGRATCDAEVRLTNGEVEEDVAPCYHAAVAEGEWTIRASLPGHEDAVSTLLVDHQDECRRSVHSIEIHMKLLGATSSSGGTPSRPPRRIPPPEPSDRQPPSDVPVPDENPPAAPPEMDAADAGSAEAGTTI